MGVPPKLHVLFIARGGVGYEKAGGGAALKRLDGRHACELRCEPLIEPFGGAAAAASAARREACFVLFDLLQSHQRRETRDRTQLAFISSITPAVQANAATRGLALGWLKGRSGGAVTEDV